MNGIQYVLVFIHGPVEQCQCRVHSFLRNGEIGFAAISFFDSGDYKCAMLSGAWAAEADYSAQPPVIICTALPEEAGATNADPPIDRYATLMLGLDIVVEAILPPVDHFVRVVMLELDLMDGFDVLHVGGVAGEHPPVAIEDIRYVGLDEKLVIGLIEPGKFPSRLFTVECPNDSVIFHRREVEDAGGLGSGISNGSLHTLSALVELPFMKSALQLVPDDFSDRQVGTNMRAISALHPGFPVFASHNNHPSVQKVPADDLPALNIPRKADWMPGLEKQSFFALGGDRVGSALASICRRFNSWFGQFISPYFRLKAECCGHTVSAWPAGKARISYGSGKFSRDELFKKIFIQKILCPDCHLNVAVGQCCPGVHNVG